MLFGLGLWLRGEIKGRGRLIGGRAGRVAKSMAGIAESLTRVKIWSWVAFNNGVACGFAF